MGAVQTRTDHTRVRHAVIFKIPRDPYAQRCATTGRILDISPSQCPRTPVRADPADQGLHAGVADLGPAWEIQPPVRLVAPMVGRRSRPGRWILADRYTRPMRGSRRPRIMINREGRGPAAWRSVSSATRPYRSRQMPSRGR